MNKQKIIMIYSWGDSRPWNSYSGYFKKIFGVRVQKVALNAGFTCPNRDGSKSYGGCTFCVNEAFNPSYCTPEKSVKQQIEEGIEFHSRRYAKATKYLAYFQAYSNSYKPLEELKAIYEQALECENVVGVIIGTRPDCVDEQKLDYFASLAERCYVAIEYGIESCYNHTLEWVNRNDTFENSIWATSQTKKRGINVGAHFILGFPTETREMMIDQTELINNLDIDNIKFHQLQIFKGTTMYKDYLAEPEKYKFFTIEEYLELFSQVLIRLRPDIIVERFVSEAPPRFHGAPTWGKIRNEQLVSMLEKSLIENGLYQGMLYK